MKIQYLAVIFIIIVLPIVLITSYYINLQIDTISMQTDYNTKLIEATRESIEAYEINTVEWNGDFSNDPLSKRKDISASMNYFMKSIANKMGIGGTSKNFIQTYIPAVVFTLYDGYYIYAPTNTDVVSTDADGLFIQDANGEPQTTGATEYKHILRPFMNYSARYVNASGSTDITVDYTLDNYISVHGKISGSPNSWDSKAGYLTYFNTTDVPTGTITGLKYNSVNITEETLSEQRAYKNNDADTSYATDSPKTFPYIYALDMTNSIRKVYKDSTEPNPNKQYFTISAKDVKSILGSINDPGSIKNGVFRKISVFSPILPSPSDPYNVTEYYQMLSPGSYQGRWFIKDDVGNYLSLTAPLSLGIIENPAGYTYKKKHYSNISAIKSSLGLPNSPNGYSGGNTIDFKDYSAVNYYVESYSFTKWVTNYLGTITASNKCDDNGNPDPKFNGDSRTIFNINSNNSPAPGADKYEDSLFMQHRKQVIRNLITNNIRQAMNEYASTNSGSFDFKMPQLLEGEWEQIENNVAMITFMQGVPIGTKYYNGYAIATSTNNKDFVDVNNMYFTATDVPGVNVDQYYHRLYCEHINATGTATITGYKSVDFTVRSYYQTDGDPSSTKNYFPHDNREDINAELADYYCVIDPSSYDPKYNIDATYPSPHALPTVGGKNMKQIYDGPYYTAIGRERYVNRPTI